MFLVRLKVFFVVRGWNGIRFKENSKYVVELNLTGQKISNKSPYWICYVVYETNKQIMDLFSIRFDWEKLLQVHTVILNVQAMDIPK